MTAPLWPETGKRDVQMEAAERVAMRRWLRARGICPFRGCDLEASRHLVRQITEAGGRAPKLVLEVRRRIKERRKAAMK